jgi:hypothetical protein
MPVIIRSQRTRRVRERRADLDTWGEEPTYFLLPPSGAVRGSSSPFDYQNSVLNDTRPQTMLQPVTFNDDTVGDARTVRLRVVGEEDNVW